MEPEPTSGPPHAESALDIEKVEVVGGFVRYTVIDVNANKHCVGGRVDGFFNSEEIDAIIDLTIEGSDAEEEDSLEV
jgi:hypothetical protein